MRSLLRLRIASISFNNTNNIRIILNVLTKFWDTT